MDENNNLYEEESFGKDGGAFDETAPTDAPTPTDAPVSTDAPTPTVAPAPVAVKKKKRGITIFLTVLLVLALGAASVYFLLPKTATTISKFSYEISEGTAVITGYNGYGTELIIPETIDGYPVTAIGAEAFTRYPSLKSATIPYSITSIGERAFYACWGLTSITIPDSVTSIGKNAFSYCGLTSVKIGNSVTSIGNCVFNG